jgi:PAS domain-containing protein
MLRALDWSASPLGEPGRWPASLATVIALVLQSKFPMFVAWGPELIFLYNDAYAEILGSKHPAAMGCRFPDIWREIWTDVAPIVDQALAGVATFHENAQFNVSRDGRQQDAWFTFSYSPLLGADNQVNGMFCVCAETTEQVRASRARIEENQRLRRLFQQAPGIIAHMTGPDHVFELANDAFLNLAGKSDVIGMPVRLALPEMAGQGLFALLDQVFTSGTPFLANDMPVRLQRSADEQLEQRFVSLILQPVVDHLGSVTGIFIEGSDVTDALRAHAAVRENEKRLRQLASTIPHLAWMAERDGVPHWYNERWYEYTGTTFDEMMAQGWAQSCTLTTWPLRNSSGGTRWPLAHPTKLRPGFAPLTAPTTCFSSGQPP